MILYVFLTPLVLLYTNVVILLFRLPELKPPLFSLIPAIALDSLVIAIIAYIISISMALMFAQKLNYEIDPNQELLAQVK